ncbi:MAG: PucR family transcriptional regulator, partial [Christensenellales bacterium]
IRIDKLIAGYIILIIPADQHYIKNDGDAMILNYAANIISANFKQENFLNAQVQRKNLSLYSNLVGNLNGVDVQESMKEALWPLPPFLLITVETEFDEQFNMSDTLLMQLMYSIRTLFKKYGISNMAVPWNNTIRCIVPFNSQAVNRSILSTIKDRVSSLFDRRIRMTVSGRLDGYDQIKSAHFEAYDLLSISRNMNLSIAFADDLLYEIAMLQTLRNSHMRTFAFKLLSTLEDYDAQHGSELIHTLQVLIENRGIQTKTANDLFLHRNTLLYRMRKIESLTGLDLSDSGDLHKAYMALYVHNFAQ